MKVNMSSTVGERQDAMLTLGQLIRQKRLERGISGSELTRRAAISRSYLQKLEDGTLQDMRLDKFCRITEALGLSVEDLLREAGYLPTIPKSSLPQPDDYLRERYKLSPESIQQAVEFLEFLVSRERQQRPRRNQ